MTPLPCEDEQCSLRYLRVCLGSESGDPGMTLYEVDHEGWVQRQVQLYSGGTRFTPEDILMCRPVETEAMMRHPAAEEIDSEEFDLLWGELESERSFYDRLPDPTATWYGELHRDGQNVELLWQPNGAAPLTWTRVPGFLRLFCKGDESTARRVSAAVFIEQYIGWSAVAAQAA